MYVTEQNQQSKMSYSHIINGFWGRNPQSHSKGNGLSFQKILLPKNGYAHMNENDPPYLFDTIHKNYLEMDHRPKCRH